MDLKNHNNPPDVILNLMHEQASFMLETCLANMRICFAIIMGMAEEKITIEEKQKKAEKYENLRKQYAEISKMLRTAGAREKESEQ